MFADLAFGFVNHWYWADWFVLRLPSATDVLHFVSIQKVVRVPFAHALACSFRWKFDCREALQIWSALAFIATEL